MTIFHFQLEIVSRNWGRSIIGTSAQRRDKKGKSVYRRLAPRPPELNRWREAFAQLIDDEFVRHGLEARVDHRSYADQGISKKPQSVRRRKRF